MVNRPNYQEIVNSFWIKTDYGQIRSIPKYLFEAIKLNLKEDMTTEDKEYIKSVIYGWFITPDRLNPNSVFNQSIDGHEDFVFIIKTTKGW